MPAHRVHSPAMPALLLGALMACALVGCREEPRTIALSNTNRGVPGGAEKRAKTVVPLSTLMKQIAACPSWSPVNGLSRARCKAWSTLMMPAVRKRQSSALAPYLGSASAPVRYAAAYALCQPVAPSFEDRSVGVAILDALDKESAQATIAWLGQAAGGVRWRATGLGARIRRMASGHPKDAVRYALLGGLSGGRDRMSDRRFDFLVDRIHRDGNSHARVRALGAVRMARSRWAVICPLMLRQAQQRRFPRVAAQAAIQLTHWKGQLDGRYQLLCAAQQGPLLGEILLRLRGNQKDSGTHFMALDRLCDARYSLPSIHRKCWRSVRTLLKTSRYRARLLTTLADRDPRCASAATPYLKHRDPAVRRAARRAAQPELFLAEFFLDALTSGQVGRARMFVGRDRWHLVPQATMKRWVKQNVKKRNPSAHERIRFELQDRREGESTGCWRRRFRGRMSGDCRKWTTRWTELRYKQVAAPRYRRRPLLVVRVADYYNQPPHPNPPANRDYRQGRRYNVVSWRVAWNR